VLELLARFLGRSDALHVEPAQSSPAQMGEVGVGPVQDGRSPLAAWSVSATSEPIGPLEIDSSMRTFISRDLQTRRAV